MYCLAVKLRIAHRISNLSAVYQRRSFLHAGRVLLGAALRVKIHHSRNALGDKLAAYHHHRLLRQLTGLIGRHHNIAVVRQNNRLLSRQIINRLQNILRAGVHTLAAAYQTGRAHLSKNLVQTTARRNRHHTAQGQFHRLHIRQHIAKRSGRLGDSRVQLVRLRRNSFRLISRSRVLLRTAAFRICQQRFAVLVFHIINLQIMQ